MKSSKEPRKKSGGSSGRKAAAVEPRGPVALAVEESQPVLVVPPEPVQPATAPEPQKKRKGRAPSEGEPLRRVLIFLGPKEIDALKALVGDRGMSTKIREILKEHLAVKS
jgi:hypothetical protein